MSSSMLKPTGRRRSLRLSPAAELALEHIVAVTYRTERNVMHLAVEEALFALEDHLNSTWHSTQLTTPLCRWRFHVDELRGYRKVERDDEFTKIDTVIAATEEAS